MKQVQGHTRFIGGIADFTQEGLVPDSYAFGRSVDVRSDPQNVSILPRTIKESGNTVVDLIKWADPIPTTLDLYLYGNAGNIYKRTIAGSYSLLRTVAGSHGNGLSYSAEDDYLYYTLDKTIGRYGPISAASPQFVDDFLAAQGGVPLNTNSLNLTSASSQYADRADSASLSITGDLTIEAQIKPRSLPSVGNSMTLASKWDESGAFRSYKLDILAISGVLGSGANGVLHITTDTTDAPIDSSCTGTINTNTLSATNASFAAGQMILIHQTRGVGAGTSQKNVIQGYTAGTITLQNNLNATYVSGAQVIVRKQYTDVTIDTGKTLSAKAWNGTVGGILTFVYNGTDSFLGTFSATGKGFRGGDAIASSSGITGEGTAGAGATQTSVNGNGGGGGSTVAGGRGGAGGGNGTAGNASDTADGGLSTGTADLTTLELGGGGGAAGTTTTPTGTNGDGGTGGGIIYITGPNITVVGLMVSGGANGVSGGSDNSVGGGGGGAGGSILLEAQTAVLGTSLITAPAGVGGGAGSNGSAGSDGGVGRIHLSYLTSYSGTTLPTLNYNQDNTLVTTTSYQLRLGISNDGTAFENLAKVTPLQLANYQHVAVSWASASSTAEFFLNAVSQGTVVGTKTAISDNAARFSVGSYVNSSSANTAFFDGLVDEVRVWSQTKSSTDLFAGISQQIATNALGLQAYYKFNNDYTDATTNGNLLTAGNAPSFSTDVPFSSPTTRPDIDRSSSGSGNTYIPPIAISESSADRNVFTPQQDPQKSLAINITDKGTGDWTVTVHDQYNNVVAAKTVTNASLTTGLYEFVFATPWRPLTNFTNNYHFHVTSTVGDGTLVTSAANDLSTATFQTFFQYLINDVDYHPVASFLNFTVFGNERYIGKLDATLYDPNFISLPAGYKIRCFAYWNEFLAIGVWRGNTITDFDMGRVYFWDGIAPTFNYYIDIPEGGVNALFGAKGELNIFAGYQGDHLVYSYSYANASPAAKIRRIPKVTDSTYVEILPGAITMWKSLLRYGVAGNSNSTDIQKGVYSWGHENIRYPEILTYDYPISTGNYGSTVKIGMTTTIGGKLLIGWQDNVSYGVDYVTGTNPVFPTARLEFLIADDGQAWHQKRANMLVANTRPIVQGQAVNLQYRIDDTAAWSPNADSMGEGDTVTRQAIPDGSYNQSQVAFDLTTSIATGPTISAVALEIDDQESSKRVG